MKRFEITQGTVFIGSLVAENEQAAIVQAKDDFAYIIEALHLDGNPPLVATEKEKTK